MPVEPVKLSVIRQLRRGFSTIGRDDLPEVEDISEDSAIRADMGNRSLFIRSC